MKIIFISHRIRSVVVNLSIARYLNGDFPYAIDET